MNDFEKFLEKYLVPTDSESDVTFCVETPLTLNPCTVLNVYQNMGGTLVFQGQAMRRPSALAAPNAQPELFLQYYFKIKLHSYKKYFGEYHPNNIIRPSFKAV